MNHLGTSVKPSVLLKALETPRTAPVAHGARHRPKSATHCEAVPSWKQVHGAALGKLKPATSAAWQSIADNNNTATHLSKRTQSSAEKWGVCFLNSHCNKHRMKHFNGLQLIIYKNCRFSMNLSCKLVINNTVSLSTF